ncbi:hypothetical protein [Methylobacterium aquaticum]|nr:hypothetical protein [Methylobacterium aquaticum]
MASTSPSTWCGDNFFRIPSRKTADNRIAQLHGEIKMKTIACVNVDLPTIDEIIDYGDDTSLRDYDIIIFEPVIPEYERIEFSGGGSCIGVDGTRDFLRTTSHWARELQDALLAGKTVFVVLSPYEEDRAATGSQMKPQKQRIYTAEKINNYATIPVKVNLRNSRGKKVIVKNPTFKMLHEITKEIMEYRVVFENIDEMQSVFNAKDGASIGGILHSKIWTGHLVFLPYFDFYGDEFTEPTDKVDDAWNEKAIRLSHGLVGQLVAIDRALKGAVEATPLPEWLNKFES